MPSVDPLLSRRRRPGYDCLDFFAEAWQHETGEDIRPRMASLFAADRSVGQSRRAFKKLAAPQSPCVVVMQGGSREPHIGMFVRGRVLHLRQRAEYMPIEVARRGFTKIRFYQ